MSAPDLFASFDPEILEDQAAKLLTAFTAVADFARPEEDEGMLFEAAVARAMIAALAAWIAHPHQDEEQHEEALEGVIAALRVGVESAQA